MKRKLWSVLLATCMVLTLIPFSAFAADSAPGTLTALQEAINAADADATITLAKDARIDLDQILKIGKAITLDLNGSTLTSENGKYVQVYGVGTGTVNLKNGTIKSNGYALTAFDGTTNLSGMTLEAGGEFGIYASGAVINTDAECNISGKYAIHIHKGVEGATYDLKGTLSSSVESGAGFSNFGSDSINYTVNLDANVTATNSSALYLPAINAITNITGGSYSGQGGIEIRGGTLNISGDPIITSSAQFLVRTTPSTGGANTYGVALAISPYSGRTLNITIDGGEFIANGVDGKTLFEMGNSGTVNLTVNGGTFRAPERTNEKMNVVDENQDPAVITGTIIDIVSGPIQLQTLTGIVKSSTPKFSSSVEQNYLADGLTWEAKSASGTTPYTYHASLEDAQTAAGLTGTVTERNNNSISVTVDHDDGVRPQTIYKVASGSTFKFPAAPETVKNGYDSFGGWQAVVGETKEVYHPEATMTVSADTTVSPYWVKNAEGIKLSLPETDTKHTLVEPTTENPDYALLFFKDEIPADPSTATEVALLQAEVLTSGTIPATNQNVIWKSDDESIVTVNANGGIIPVGVGSTKITATVEGTEIQTVCVVTVTAPATTPSGKDLEATPKEEVKLPTTEELEKLPEDMQTVDQIKTALQVKLVSMTSMTKEDVGTPNQKPSGTTQTSGSAIYELEVTYEGENIPLTDEQVQKEGGVWVTIPYPDNLVGNPNDFDFIIIHLSLSSGQFETIIPEKSSGGLRFFMSGFSPIIIGWSTTPIKTVTTSEPAIPPKDDDTPSSPSPSVVISGITTNRRPGGTTTADSKPSDSPNATPSTTPSTTTPTALPFKDVEANAWYLDAVNFVYAKGLMKGIDDSTFAPKADTSRAMLVTMLYRLEGEPEATPADFNDVRADFWYTDAIGWATANGIVNGYGNGAFGPEDPLTREQAATIFYRYTKFKGIDTDKTADLSAFSDNETISSFAVDAMAWANAVQLINGTSETTLSPAGSAERAQIATILMRYCNNIITDLV